jgi:hypothetical protein
VAERTKSSGREQEADLTALKKFGIDAGDLVAKAATEGLSKL